MCGSVEQAIDSHTSGVQRERLCTQQTLTVVDAPHFLLLQDATELLHVRLLLCVVLLCSVVGSVRWDASLPASSLTTHTPIDHQPSDTHLLRGREAPVINVLLHLVGQTALEAQGGTLRRMSRRHRVSNG